MSRLRLGWPMRLALLALGALLLEESAALFRGGQPVLYPWVSVPVVVASALGALAWGVALVRLVPRWAGALLLTGALLVAATPTLRVSLSATPTSLLPHEAALAREAAASVLRAGGHPYRLADADWRAAARLPVAAAYRPDGTPAPTAPPAPLALLLTTLAQALGIAQASRWVAVAGVWLAVAVVWWGARGPWRALGVVTVVAPAWASGAAFGEALFVWGALLGAAVVGRRRAWVAGPLLGLALAAGWGPWLALPLILLVWGRARGARHALVTLAWALGVWLVFVLPFLAWDAAALREAILAWWGPRLLPSTGLVSAWARFGGLPLRAWGLWSAQVGVGLLGGAALLLWPGAARRGLVWLVPPVVLGLGVGVVVWPWAVPLLVHVLTPDDAPPLTPLSARRTRATAYAVAGCAVVGVVLLVAAAMLSTGGGGVMLSVRGPAEVFPWGEPLLQTVTVVVRNDQATPLTPRVFVQLPYGGAARAWRLDGGPDTLAAGAEASYRVTADGLPARMIPAERGGLLLIVDAQGDGTPLARHVFAPDGTLNHTDLVQNAAFRFWRAGVPVQWSLAGGTAAWQDGSATPLMLGAFAADGDALSQVALAQTITFPTMLTVAAAAPDDPTATSGLLLDDGTHTLLAVFYGVAPPGLADAAVAVSGGAAGVFALDVPALWAAQGWSLPEATPRNVYDVVFPARQVRLALVCGHPTGVATVCPFGPLEQPPRFGSGQALWRAFARGEG